MRRFSWVWLVPLLSLILFGSVAWQTHRNKGPLIAIHFDNAAGMKPEQTVVRHRSVDIGVVEKIEFDDAMQGVVVHARLSKEFRPYLGDTTRFWVVSARVNGLQVSGLGTLLSGSYISMDWEEKPSRRLSVFRGETDRPVTAPGTPGRRVRLTMEEGGALNVGSAVFFKKIEVGRVESRKIMDDFSQVELEAFVQAPFDQLLTSSTKFWNAAGVNVNLGDNGLDVQMESLEALFSGGVAFAPLGKGGEPITEDGKSFKVYESRALANESIFNENDSQTFRYIVEFDKGARGLAADAPVEYYGIQVGAVDEVIFDIGDPDEPESGRIYAEIKMQPHRIGMPETTPARFNAVMDSLIDGGMRVQLASGNFLSGSKYINLIEAADAPPATIDYSALPFPRLPTVATGAEVITQNVETLVERLSKAPIDDLVKSATLLLDDVDGLVTNSSMQKIPYELVASLRSVQSAAGGIEGATSTLPQLIKSLNLVLANTDGVLQGLAPESELYLDLSDAIRDLKFTMRSIEGLASTLEQKPNSILLGK